MRLKIECDRFESSPFTTQVQKNKINLSPRVGDTDLSPLLGYGDNVVCLEVNVERHIERHIESFFLKTVMNLRFRDNKRMNAQEVLRSADIS